MRHTSCIHAYGRLTSIDSCHLLHFSVWTLLLQSTSRSARPHMRDLFTRDSCDLAATVQDIILEMQFVMTTMSSDTLRWKLYPALNLMQHISRGLQRVLSRKSPDDSIQLDSPNMMCDDYLRSTPSSADVQLS